MFSRIVNTIEGLKNFSLGNLSDYLQKEFNNRQIVIYGAGAFGQEIFNHSIVFTILENIIFNPIF